MDVDTIRFRPWSPLYCRPRTLVSRRRRSDAVRAGREPKLAAWHFAPLRTAKSLTIQRTREGSMRGVRTGGAHDHSVDCPSPSMPLVYVSCLQTTRPDGWCDIRGGKVLMCALAAGQGCALRLLRRLPCSACFAVCCGCACPDALALLLAVFV